MSHLSRKILLTAHVVSSVEWLGAVVAFLIVAAAALQARDFDTMRSAHWAMNLIAWSVIVPLAFISPITGVIQALSTEWRLFQHYWVFIKFLITIPSTLLLLLHMNPIGHLARVLSDTALAAGEVRAMQIQLVANAGAAIIVLLVATVLSVVKPKGRTPWARPNVLN